MADDQKSTLGKNPATNNRERGIRIFTYPKIIFLFPTFLMSIICWVGMWMISSENAPTKKVAVNESVQDKNQGTSKAAATGDSLEGPVHIIPASGPIPLGGANPTRFRDPANVLGLLFLTVLFLNLLILAIDFPRFTIFALILLATTILFFLLWLGMFVRILEPLERLFENVYVYANGQFYFIVMMLLAAIYGIILTTRWLDYWEILPNEILHHHGPLSDLERFPTLNLKFDKEIPDVFEHFMFGAGRLILNVPNEHRAIILDTVLHVSHKEEALKKLMSRLEVRVSSDSETGI